MGILLYEPLPLRTTAALGDFAEESVLPHRYGDLTSGRFRLLRLDDRTFFVADHPMRVTAAFVDGQAFDGWQQVTRSDGAGNTWTVLLLSAPAAPDSVLSACGTGKRSGRTGGLIENPADIVEDILRIAGRADAWFDQLRAEAAAVDLRLAGSIDEAMSVRAAIDAVCLSAGAIWCAGMARLYPADVSGYVGEIDKATISNLTVSADLDDTADVLRLYYDPDKASGKNQHYIEVVANPKTYGGVPTYRSFNWLRTPANAESVSKRFLPWLAGQRVTVEFDCEDQTLSPGQWQQIVAHPEWPFEGDDPIVMVRGITGHPSARTRRVVAEALLTKPTARIVAHSIALPTTREAGVEIRVGGGTATLVIRDQNDQPIFAARVSLDGGPAKKTNASGAVSFDVATGDTPKEHRLAIQAPGKVPTVQSVWL